MSNIEEQNDVIMDFKLSQSKSILSSISQKWNVFKVSLGLLNQSRFLISHSLRHKKIYLSIIIFLIIMTRKKLIKLYNKKEIFPSIFENQRVEMKDQTNDYINVLEQFQKGIKIPTPSDLYNRFINKKQEDSNEGQNIIVSDVKKSEKNIVSTEVKKHEHIKSETKHSLQENERYVLEKHIKVWEEKMNHDKEHVFQQYFMYEKNKYYRFEMSCLLSDISDVNIVIYKIKGSDFEYSEFDRYSMEGNGVQSNKKDEELYPFKMISDYMHFDDSGKIMLEFVFSPIDKEKTELGIKNISLKVIEHPIDKVHKTPFYFMTFHNEKKKFALPIFLKTDNLFSENKWIEENKKKGDIFRIQDLF